MSTGLPQFNVPPCDPKTGQWNRQWWLFLSALWERTGGAQGITLDDFVATFEPVSVPTVVEDETPATDLSARVAELENQLADLHAEMARARIEAVAAELAKQLDDGRADWPALATGAEVLKAMRDLETQLAMLPDPSARLAALGTMAKQNASAVAITGGTIAGLTSLAVNGGINLANTGAATGFASLTTTSGIILAATGKLTLNKALAGDVIANLVNLDAGGYGLRVAGGNNGGGYVASFNKYDGTNVALLTADGNLALSSLTVTGAAPNPGAGKVAFGANTSTTVGAAGAAAALPATPSGYLIFNNGGTSYKLPFYNV
jgi:hypothetical protein